jgi:hypothetical protein
VNPLIKTYISEGVNSQYLIAKQGTDDNQAAKSDAAAATGLGVVCQPGDVADEERIDITMMGEAEVLCAGAIAAGRSFTSDANGKAVLASTGERAIGIVRETGAAARIVPCVVCPHTAA